MAGTKHFADNGGNSFIVKYNEGSTVVVEGAGQGYEEGQDVRAGSDMRTLGWVGFAMHFEVMPVDEGTLGFPGVDMMDSDSISLNMAPRWCGTGDDVLGYGRLSK